MAALAVAQVTRKFTINYQAQKASQVYEQKKK